MFATIAVLFGSLVAHASQIMITIPDGSETVESPFGPMIKQRAHGLCLARDVFIGTIDEAVARTTEDPQNQRLVSDLTFRVRHTLHGERERFRYLTVSGVVDAKGRRNGIPAGTGYIVPQVGLHYLVASVPLRQALSPQRPIGSPSINLALPIDRVRKKPGPLDLDMFCAEHGFQRYEDLDFDSMPLESRRP